MAKAEKIGRLIEILLIFLIAFCTALAATAQVHQQSLVDDFHDRESLKQWQFSNGPEFPGASGSLSFGQGHAGSGAAKLNFRIKCDHDQQTCGHYVAAYRDLSPAAQFHALSLWVSLPPEMRLIVRVRDETGQTLQYDVDTPAFESTDLNAWTPVLLALDQTPDQHWGGANNGHLNGAIDQVGILADSRNPVATQGSLSFDDVTLLDSAASVVDLSGATQMIPLPASAASLSSRLGVNIHSLADEAGLDAAQSAGFTFVRADLLWARVERNGQYDFARYDRLLARLDARRMGALLVIGYGHPDHGGSQPRTQEDIAAYARFAQAAAAHFKGRNVRYEIWNEPNLTKFLPDASLYPEILRAGVRAIRAGDPSAIVTTGGVSGIDLNFLGNAALAGPAGETNAIAIHPYRSSGPETAVSDFLRLRRLVDVKISRDLPIWDTECGYSSASTPASSDEAGSNDPENRQAVLAVREVLTMWRLGLPVQVWYDLRNDGSNRADREANFGLLNTNGSDKPSMSAIRILSAEAKQRNLTGILTDLPAGIHALQLTGTTGVTLIVWCSQPGAVSQVQVATDSIETAIDLLGHTLPLSSSADPSKSSLEVSERDGPVYLHLHQPAAPVN